MSYCASSAVKRVGRDRLGENSQFCVNAGPDATVYCVGYFGSTQAWRSVKMVELTHKSRRYRSHSHGDVWPFVGLSESDQCIGGERIA